MIEIGVALPVLPTVIDPLPSAIAVALPDGAYITGIEVALGAISVGLPSTSPVVAKAFVALTEDTFWVAV